MNFHSRTLKLLNVRAAILPSAVCDLDAAEARIARKLPASVREWYSLSGACKLLRQYSNDDWAVEVSEFGLSRNEIQGGGPTDLLARNLVVFRYENQGVCVWAFCLDGSDDPPVVVNYDSKVEPWTQCASTFSEHLYAWMWDYALVIKKDLLIQAQNQPVTEAALTELRHSFDVGPETYGWPGHTQHRFSKCNKRILIWASERQADWWLTADAEEPLRELINRVRHCDQVGESMWSNSERGQSLL